MQNVTIIRSISQYKEGSSSITQFCHTLKNLVDDLKDVDSTITEIELVMQILWQLPSSYHSIVDVITDKKSFPSLIEAKNIFFLHEFREAAFDSIIDPSMSQSVAFFSSSNHLGKQRNWWSKNKNNSRNNSKVNSNEIATDCPPPFVGILGNAPPTVALGHTPASAAHSQN